MHFLYIFNEFYSIRLYGSVNFSYPSYVVLNLDMSQLNIVECKDDLDYIIWMPSDGVSILRIYHAYNYVCSICR